MCGVMLVSGPFWIPPVDKTTAVAASDKDKSAADAKNGEAEYETLITLSIVPPSHFIVPDVFSRSGRVCSAKKDGADASTQRRRRAKVTAKMRSRDREELEELYVNT